ncbi:MarR family winged helix-turn-helix transcriptional regulator [Leucobacter sp. HY1910]
MNTFGADANDSHSEQGVDRLVHASAENEELEVPGMSQEQVEEVLQVVNGLAHLRNAERTLTESARVALGVSAQDMRALQFVVSEQQGDRIVSPSMLADYLRVSAASITKLLNKLERAEHLSRSLHPHDRRGIQIEVSPATRALVQRSVGRQQARRFNAAAQLSSAERLVVARFLDEVTRGIVGDRAAWNAVKPPTTD